MRRVRAVLLGLVLGLFLAELGLRALTVTERDGTQRILWIPLAPYELPLYESETSPRRTGYSDYCPRTGWAPRPFGASANGLYHADQYGLRAPESRAREFPPDRPVLGIFGDSFAHSDEVPYEQSLGHYLDRELPDWTVVIAGVPAYGIDQSYLRYLALREKLRFDAVLICVQPNDFERNVRIFNSGGFRRGGLPFSKPRLVAAADGYEWFNLPPIRGDAIRRVLENYETSDYRRRDYFYLDGSTARLPTDRVRLLRFLRSLSLHREYYERYDRKSDGDASDEITRVSAELLRRFSTAVREDGALPLVASLPMRYHLAEYLDGDDWWSATLGSVRDPDPAPYLDLSPALAEACGDDADAATTLFTGGGDGHYRAGTNRLVAGALAKWLAPRLR